MFHIEISLIVYIFFCRKFVSSLPDKGKKIIEFRQKLLNLISKKQDLYHETALPQTLISSGEEKIKQHLNPLIKPKSRFSEEEKVFKSMENDSVEMTKKDVARDIVSMESQPRGPEEEAVIMHDNKSPMQTTQDNANTLPSPLQTAQITTDGASEFAKLRDKSHQGDQKTTQVVTNLSCGVNKTPKTAQSQDTDVNMLENAMERMEFGPGVPSIESEELRDKILENSAKVSSQFKTNRYDKRHCYILKQNEAIYFIVTVIPLNRRSTFRVPYVVHPSEFACNKKG